MKNPNDTIEISKTTLRRSLAFTAVLAVAVPGYVVASGGFSLAGSSQDGDANNDGNIDEGEAKNALYGLATELNAVKGSLGGGTKAVLVNSTPTGADCDAAGKLLMHGDKLYTCTIAGSAPILQKTCPVGQMLNHQGACTTPNTDITSNDAQVCADAGGTWDGSTSTCSPGLNCWAAGYCHQTHVMHRTGLPNAAFAPASQASCDAAGRLSDWSSGVSFASFTPQSSSTPYHLPIVCASN